MAYRKTKSGLYVSDTRAEYTANFVESLNHTKAQWHGEPFELLPWQREIITDIFGTVDPVTGYRQYDMAYIEIPKKQGKSELAAALALYLMAADGEYEA